MNGLTVLCRSTSSDREEFDRKFAEFPEQIAKEQGRDVSQHSRNLWLQLLRYGDRRQCDFWIAASKHSGEILARIGADIPAEKPEEGSIGFFECRDDSEARAAAAALIQVAESWLASKKVKEVYAPMDFNSWFNYRFKVRDPQQPALADQVWEPSAPDFHKDIFTSESFENCLRFASLSYELSKNDEWLPYLDKLRPIHQMLTEKKGYSFRPLSTGNQLVEDLRSLHELSHIAFANNPMFEPIPFEMFAAMNIFVTQKYNISASRLCFTPDGKAVAFALCFCIGEELIYKTVAVHPDHRSIGVANALTFEISDYCFKHGILRSTGALIREGNTSERIGKAYGEFATPTHVHRYVLLKKVIT